MDLTSGSFQAPIASESRPFSSVVTDTGVYQWTRVPMGIKCAGAYFQQQMQFILDDLVENICFLYLDDIVVFGRNEAEYLHNVDAMLKRLQQRNVYLSPKKCSFGMTEVEYVFFCEWLVKTKSRVDVPSSSCFSVVVVTELDELNGQKRRRTNERKRRKKLLL